MALQPLHAKMLALLCLLLFPVVYGHSQSIQTKSVSFGENVKTYKQIFKHVDVHNITKRTNNYADALRKGCGLLTDLANPATMQSAFGGNQFAVQDNGWEPEPDTNRLADDLKPVFESLGFSTNAQDYVLKDWYQSGGGQTTQAYGNKPVGTRYTASYAQYENTFNVRDGVIIAEQNFGPAYFKKYDPSIIICPLAQLSDVIFLQWRSAAGVVPKWFFRHKIAEEDTNAILDEILAMQTGKPDQAPAWPGYTWKMDNDFAKALLGTPNGVGVAYFLGQHRAQLGGRLYTVDEAHFFSTEVTLESGTKGTARNLAFRVVPVV